MRDGARWTTPVRVALTVWCVAAPVLTACGERPAEPTADGDATPTTFPAPTKTSGALGDGFEIEAGSGLVGAVFPTLTGNGWWALLRGDRDAHRVFTGYIRQAERLGLSLGDPGHPLPDDEWCSDTDSESDDEEPDPFSVRCQVGGQAAHGRWWDLQAFLKETDDGYLILTAQANSAVRPSPLPLIPDGPVAAATEVEVAPGMTPSTDDAAVRVVEGTTPIIEPLPACGAGGYLAMLEVTGDLPAVMRGYNAQFTIAESELRGDKHVLSAITGPSAGAGTQAAIAVPGDPSYLLISRCND